MDYDAFKTQVVEFVTPVVTGEWATWDDTEAAEFVEAFRATMTTLGVMRTRLDETIDKLHNVGKLTGTARIRKARTSNDEGEKVDPVVAALAAFAGK